MKTYRVVCTKNPEETVVDFAAADNARNSRITHNNLLKLRQYYTPDSENLLPPLMLHDDNGNIEVNFDKPEKASPNDFKKLEETAPLILSSYNRFKHRGLENTLEITDETLAVAYGFFDAYKMSPSSREEEIFKEKLIESRRYMNTKAMKRNINTMTLREKFYKSNGD